MSDIRFNRWLHQSGTGGVSQDSSGNIGIGSTQPLSALDLGTGNIRSHNVHSTGIVTSIGLDINGNADISGNLNVGGVLTYEDVTNIDSVGIITAQAGIRVTGGLVGIGTDNPGTKLDVRGGNWANGDIVVGQSGNAGRIKFRRGADGSDTGSIGFSAADNNSVLSMNVASGDGTLTFQTNSAERLRIASTGLVSITTGDLVVGDDTDSNAGTKTISVGSISSGAGGLQLWGNPTNGNSFIQFGDGTASANHYRGYVNYRHGDDSLRFGTTGSDRLLIASDGQIGMGKAGTVTPNGNSPLTIQESDSNSETICLRATNSGGNGSQPGIVMKTAAGGHIGGIYCDVNSDYMRLSTSGTDRVIITNGGSMGVNIASPTGNLEVNGNDGINISNATRTGTNGAQWRLIPHNGGGSATNLRLYEGVGATEVINITKDGRLLLGTTVAPSSANTLLRVHCPISSSSADAIQIGQNTNGADKVAASLGIVVQNGGESTNAADLVFKTASGGSAAERLRITNTTASVASTGVGANGCGVVGINETDPAGDALALAVHAPYGMDDPRPLVYMKRSHGIGGGNGTDETVLHIDGTASYNSAGVIYGIKVNTQHNLNGSHYSGHFVNHGSQYAANGTSAVYVETHKKDTNGGGAVIALHAKGRITTGISNNGYAIAGFFQTGNNINGRPIVCLQEYTANTYTHQIEFRKHNGSSIVSVGSIKSNNSATQYNTSSDYRLKENVVSLTGAIDRLKQLQPKRFNFIGDEETIDGFIAHEVSSTAPYAVSGEKDAVKIELVMDEDGKEQFDENGEIISKEVIDPQGVDYGKLSALTIAALQEALVKIETLEAKVASLEG